MIITTQHMLSPDKMKKVYTVVGILFSVLTLCMIILQFNGFRVGNMQVGKQKIPLQSAKYVSFEDSNFQKEILNSEKLICLNIWATWCEPCIAEMPELNKIKAQFENQNVDFVSLSLNNDSTKLRSFLASKVFDFRDITFENIAYKNAILNFLEGKPLDNENPSQIVPLTYLLKDGAVIEKINGGIEPNKLIKLIRDHI